MRTIMLHKAMIYEMIYMLYHCKNATNKS